MDKELMVLSAVEHSPAMTQRDLAVQTGLSLGTVNILMKKMVREGMVKLEKLPSDRAAYILTPKGMEEKVQKTRIYLRNHYHAIERMRYQLEQLVKERLAPGEIAHLNIQQPELKELLKQVLNARGCTYSEFVGSMDEQSVVLADYDSHVTGESNWINIHDHLKL